jgi:hypothetical protein
MIDRPTQDLWGQLYSRLHATGTKKFIIAMLLVMTAGTELVTFIALFLLHHHCDVMLVSFPPFDRGKGRIAQSV